MHPSSGPNGTGATGGLVLIIDDDEFIVRSTAMVLQAEGLEVLTAKNGEEGIAQAQKRRPNVILLDIMMPGLSGWETLERLKLDSATHDIPVVIFSARDLARGGAVSRERGAEAFVQKPFEPQMLVQLVHKHLAAMRVLER